MLVAAMENKELTKEDIVALHRNQKRNEQIKQAYTLANKEEFDPEEAFAKLKSKKKSKTPALPKPDTKELTLALFKEGKNPDEIAKERKMSLGTIEGHLAHFVAKHEIKGSELVPQKKLDRILEAIGVLKTIRLNDLREHLGKSYSYGEIKIAIAVYLAEGN